MTDLDLYLSMLCYYSPEQATGELPYTEGTGCTACGGPVFWCQSQKDDRSATALCGTYKHLPTKYDQSLYAHIPSGVIK